MNAKKAANSAAVGVLICGSIVPNVGQYTQKEVNSSTMVLTEPIHTPTSRTSRYAPRDFARTLLATQGYGSGQYRCLSRLWQRESRWRVNAHNKRSGAYGIPQRIDGYGKPFMDDYRGQIVWGLNYIKSRYGTPCAALQHHLKRGWY